MPRHTRSHQRHASVRLRPVPLCGRRHRPDRHPPLQQPYPSTTRAQAAALSLAHALAAANAAAEPAHAANVPIPAKPTTPTTEPPSSAVRLLRRLHGRAFVGLRRRLR